VSWLAFFRRLFREGGFLLGLIAFLLLVLAFLLLLGSILLPALFAEYTFLRRLTRTSSCT
jgi:hypothetical protein